MLVDSQCSAHRIALDTLGRQLPPPPLGACMIPIVDSYLLEIRPGMRVLDIGCGSWRKASDHCATVGAEYHAIDAVDTLHGHRTLATRLENLAALSYPDKHFDLIIGNQTMEHWAENGCSLQRGLYQCFRSCKVGGRMFMNVPIHFHGTKTFMLGRLDRLHELISRWFNDITYEKWGAPPEPVPPLLPYPGYWRLKNKPAYVLDVRATKRVEAAPYADNAGAARGRAAQVRHYPFSYNLYRVAKKTGLLR